MWCEWESERVRTNERRFTEMSLSYNSFICTLLMGNVVRAACNRFIDDPISCGTLSRRIIMRGSKMLSHSIYLTFLLFLVPFLSGWQINATRLIVNLWASGDISQDTPNRSSSSPRIGLAAFDFQSLACSFTFESIAINVFPRQNIELIDPIHVTHSRMIA